MSELTKEKNEICEITREKFEIIETKKEKFELLCDASNRILKINTSDNEKYTVRKGSMVSMSSNVNLKLKETTFDSTARRLLAGGTLFLQEYTSNGDGELLIAPTNIGDILKIEMKDGKHYRISTGNFLACTENVKFEVCAKIKGNFGSGDKLFVLEASGEGTLFITSVGGVYEKNLKEDEEYIVDSGHLVIWDASMEIKTEIAGKGIGTSMLSGEGFVGRLKGPGKIFLQTRKEALLRISKL